MQAHERLEKEFGEWIGNSNVAVCSSGTAALHLALEALQLPPGSGVVVPEYTMVACARAVTLAGLEPVFVDCGDDLLIDPTLIELAIDNFNERKFEERGRMFPSPTVKAIMPVHIYGRRCDGAAIYRIADSRRLKVVEDCAEFHGGRTMLEEGEADVSCWSFYRNKIIAGEEGGAVASRDDRIVERIRLLRSMGFTERHDFIHIPRGHNYRMSNVHAELVLGSLTKWADNQAWRQQVIQWYDEFLPEGVIRMPPREAPWVYDVQLKKQNCEFLVRKLNEAGIQARQSFKPMSMQPEYRYPYTHGMPFTKLKAYELSQEIVYFPVGEDMIRSRVETIMQTFDSLL